MEILALAVSNPDVPGQYSDRRRVGGSPCRAAAERGIYAVTAAPLGFSTAWLTFDPKGLSFDRYFDLTDEQTELEQIVAFAVGLAPALLQPAPEDRPR